MSKFDLSSKRYSHYKIFVYILILIMFLTPYHIVFSKTLEEVDKELEEKKESLKSLEEVLKESQNSANYFKSQKYTSSSALEQVKNELEQIELEIVINENEYEKVKSELEVFKLELERGNIVINEKIVDLYIYNKQGIVDFVLENGEMDGFWKDFKYQEKILDDNIENINVVSQGILDINNDIKSLELSIDVLQEQNGKLTSQKADLEQKIAYYNSMEVYNLTKQEGIRAQMGAVQQEIEGLTAEQKRIIDEETALIGDANGGTKPLESGEYYFYGRGRSLYQGHGLGFSQYGAMGGALKGMSGDAIATFYFKSSNIGSSSGNVEVIGYGTMNVEDYVSGLGEIPDKACGTEEQANSRPDKYRVDNPSTIWDCWPEESIKAQVIVARSYALAYGGPICTTAVCQVYKGGDGKRWASTETSEKVLMSGGTIIKAYYSSDNNNGWGTATHRNPVWCWDFSGNCGSGFSWLQAVNDAQFASKGPYTDWMWRTNSYSLTDLQAMLEWFASKNYNNSSNMRQLLNEIGSLNDIQIQRDASGRTSKIKIIGSNNSRDVNGEIFKEIWNLWVGNVKMSGEVDPIFSLTYYFVQVP